MRVGDGSGCAGVNGVSEVVGFYNYFCDDRRSAVRMGSLNGGRGLGRETGEDDWAGGCGGNRVE